MLLLSALPCGDVLEAKNFASTSLLSISAEEEDCNEESCAASCMCACCGQSVIGANLLSLHIKPLVAVRASLNAGYYLKSAQRVRNIWQPPKLV